MYCFRLLRERARAGRAAFWSRERKTGRSSTGVLAVVTHGRPTVRSPAHARGGARAHPVGPHVPARDDRPPSTRATPWTQRSGPGAGELVVEIAASRSPAWNEGTPTGALIGFRLPARIATSGSHYRASTCRTAVVPTGLLVGRPLGSYAIRRGPLAGRNPAAGVAIDPTPLSVRGRSEQDANGGRGDPLWPPGTEVPSMGLSPIEAYHYVRKK